MNGADTNSNKKWFEDWFNSPYYHTLYKHRDHKEAEQFIANLNQFLKPAANSRLLDAACGKGRHALYLANLGYQVDGFDLSPNNIEQAKKNEGKTLQFYINDIRKPLKKDHYDYVFNLFTSFGYFDDVHENQLALHALALNLKPNGVLILDFMNCAKVIASLPQKELKEIDGIVFQIEKQFTKGKIVKTIRFDDKGKSFCFQEEVNVINKELFEQFFKKANLTIEAVFGDYELSTFDEQFSDRLIFIARKK